MSSIGLAICKIDFQVSTHPGKLSFSMCRNKNMYRNKDLLVGEVTQPYILDVQNVYQTTACFHCTALSLMIMYMGHGTLIGYVINYKTTEITVSVYSVQYSKHLYVNAQTALQVNMYMYRKTPTCLDCVSPFQSLSMFMQPIPGRYLLTNK